MSSLTALQPSKYLNKLQSHNVLIFGGTSGLGFCVAEASLEHGASVTISGSQPSKLDNALARLRAAYPSQTAIPGRLQGKTCDLTQTETATLESELNTLLDFASHDKKVPIDHIVFTAGNIFAPFGLDQTTIPSIHAAQQVRLVAPAIIAKLLGPYMPAAPTSSYTLTTGTSAHVPPPGWGFLGALGGATEGLTRSLAVDLRPRRVNLVELGSVRTELLDGLLEKLGATKQEKIDTEVGKLAAKTLVGEVGRPEDTAEAYLYCMKDRFTTGGIVATNGGRLLAPGSNLI